MKIEVILEGKIMGRGKWQFFIKKIKLWKS